MTSLSARQVVTAEMGNRSGGSLVQTEMSAHEGSALAAGTRLGSYQIVRLLAQGGMADIYLGREIELARGSSPRLCGWTASPRFVAIKILNKQRNECAESCALFADEARLVGLLDHANLSAVHEVAEENGLSYLVMEYVHGADLREILGQAMNANVALAYECAVSIVCAAAAGLDHAHRARDAQGKPLDLVHRDVSLSNIMVGHDGSVKVIDFGIAQSRAAVHVTNPGIVRGKASYMSPEQCLGDAIDRRTDIFALGVVLYELTTGRRCFGGNTDFERMLSVVRGDWTPPSAVIASFPHALERVIRTALSLDPAHRYATAAAMIEDLEAVAALEGWFLGARTTAGLMRELFGSVAFPIPDEDDDVTVVCPMSFEDVLDDADEPVVHTAKRRLARGTHSEVHRAQAACDEIRTAELFDDLPTRGRRAIQRVTYAAA